MSEARRNGVVMKQVEKNNHSIGGCGRWLIVALLIGGGVYIALPEMREQVIGGLPFLVLLLCPLMHIFMHRRHGHGHHNNGNSSHGGDRG